MKVGRLTWKFNLIFRYMLLKMFTLCALELMNLAELCCFHPVKVDACFHLKKNMGIIDFIQKHGHQKSVETLMLPNEELTI